MSAATHAPEDLLRVTAELGADPNLIQGAGGNISLKVGDRLWVKASGCWMADALRRPVFVELSLPAVRQALALGAADAFEAAVVASSDTGRLKPSIETALHALMPHRAVLHAHAINSVTASVLIDGGARFLDVLGDRLVGAVVDYVRPGAALAQAVAQALAGDRVPDVILLRNHGVVVGAGSPAAAAAMLSEVERRLAFAPRRLAAARRDTAGSLVTDQYECLPAHGAVAGDSFLFGLLTRVTLVPDQAVFLGGPVCGVDAGGDLTLAAACAERLWGRPPTLLFAADGGAYGRRDRSAGAQSMIEALMAIARRIPKGAGVSGLPDNEVIGLLGWDAEQFRQRMDLDRR